MNELRPLHNRCGLENLTNELSDTPLSVDMAHELERSRTYLHDHCSTCGDAITGAEYAQIYEQECARVGAAGVASIEARSICLVCYAHLRRTLAAFAPSLLECPPIEALRDDPSPICLHEHPQRGAVCRRLRSLSHPGVGHLCVERYPGQPYPWAQ